MPIYKDIIVKLIDKGVPMGTLHAALKTNNLLTVVKLATIYDVAEEITMLKKISSYCPSDIIVLGKEVDWKEKEEPAFIRNLSPGERVKRLKELQRGVPPEELAKREKEEEEHANKVRKEVDAEGNATSKPTAKEITQPELPLSNGSNASHLIIAKKRKIKGKISKGLAEYWKNHFRDRSKGSFSEAVKILKKHDIKNPEALAAYLEHESTSPKKWPAED